MAEPTPDPDPRPPRRDRAGRRRATALTDAGLEAASLAMMTFIAVGFVAYAGRREIGRELALAWLKDRGIEAAVTLDDLDASGFTGAIRLGSQADPVFSAERIEVAYDLTTPWNGGEFGLATRAVRLVRPRVQARLDDKGLTFGALQPLIDELLKAPRQPKTPGPTVLIEAARLVLATPGGLAQLSGDASLVDGELLRFDGRLAPMRFATADLSFETAGAVLKARQRDDRLTVDTRLRLASLTAAGLDLSDADAAIELDLSYPDLKTLSAAGPAALRAAVRARSADLGDGDVQDLEANLSLIGRLSGDLRRGGLAGRLKLTARGEALAAPGLEARGLTADLDVARLAVARDDQGVSATGVGQLDVRADQALAGGLALTAATAKARSQALAVVIKPAERSFSGPFTLDLDAARAAANGLVLTGVAARTQGQLHAHPPGLTLAMTGSARATGGLNAIDANRLAAGLPDPAGARALAATLRRFDLRAPAVKLAMTDGAATLSLAAPVTATAPGGARASLTALGGPLLAGTADARHGAFAASLAGGGLPSLNLKVASWRADPGGLMARLSLAGTVDVAPIRGLTGTLDGEARMAGGDVDFRLTRCADLTAPRLEMGDSPIEALGLRLCPAEPPLVRMVDGAWTATARFDRGAALLTGAQARAVDLAGTFTGGGRGGLTHADLALTAGRLSDAGDKVRFQPIAAQGRVGLAGGAWTGRIDAATATGRPLGEIRLRHDVASGRGVAEIDASRLAFAKGGLQPAELSPLAAFVQEAQGTAAFTGRFAWDAKGMTSQGRLSTRDLDFRSPLGPVVTLSGDIAFVSLAPLISAPDQGLKVVRIDSITPLEAIEAGFTLGAKALHVSKAAFDAAKGRISIEPVDVPLDGGPIRGAVVVEHLDLGQLIADSSLADKVKVEAVVDGRLPFEFSDKGFRFLDGRLHAIQPGRISIARAALTAVQTANPDAPGAPAPQVPINAIQDFAYQAMENLQFETLEATVNSTDQGRLGVLFHIKGEHDPKIAEKAKVRLLDLLRGTAFQKRIALPAKTPVDLTLDTSLNFDELLAAWRSWFEGAAADPARSAKVQPNSGL